MTLTLEQAQKFEFNSQIWLWQAPKAAWHFVTLPQDDSEKIKFFANRISKRGWGSVRVEACIGNSQWRTSIFPSKKADAYILPIKASVRKAEKLALDDEVTVQLTLI